MAGMIRSEAAEQKRISTPGVSLTGMSKRLIPPVDNP
jgi:hypothetical protein